MAFYSIKNLKSDDIVTIFIILNSAFFQDKRNFRRNFYIPSIDRGMSYSQRYIGNLNLTSNFEDNIVFFWFEKCIILLMISPSFLRQETQKFKKK